MTSAFAVYTTSYELRTPYISTNEYINAPVAVDYNNLLPGGSADANLSALQETIGRASSWIDQYTCGVSGTLCATVETENARVWGSYRNTLSVHPRYWPVVEVQSFSYSTQPAGLINNNSASVNPSTSIMVYPQSFEVAQAGAVSWGLAGSGGIVPRAEFTCAWRYVAGWPNTTLAASVAAGSTSVQPSVVTGIYPGTMLTLYDLPNDEPCTVASTYIPGDAAVPLTAPLQYDHLTTATITNLPPAVKQAAIHATTALIKQRGSGALIVQDMGAVTKMDADDGFVQGSSTDWSVAMTLLTPFKQQYVGW